MTDQFILTPYCLDQPVKELEDLATPGWVVNKPALPDKDVLHCLPVLHHPIADFAADAVTKKNRPVSIAGDCCTAIAVLAGLMRAGYHPAVIWLDAHGDFNTPETTPSGFIGGMPLAMIVGRGDQALMRAVDLRPLLEEQVFLLDGRALDPLEKEALAGSKVHQFTNIFALVEALPPSRPLYVHLDADVINPEEAPAMEYRAAGGPSSAELRGLFRALAGTRRVCAVSMATWNPEMDRDGKSRKVSMTLLETLIGTKN